MRPILIIIILVFTASTMFGQTTKGTFQIAKNTDKVFLLTNDSLKVIIDTKAESVTGFDIQKNMPWIGAVLVGLLTVLVNFLINRQSRQFNRESLTKQLEHNTATTDKQLSNSKDIALAQIENTRKINQTDFNKSVLSGNRQAWINDLRDLISKILAKTVQLSIKKQITHQEFEELKFLITKTELMLNVTKDKDFITALKELESCLFEILLGEKEFADITSITDKVKTHTQVTLKTEWERVKKGE
jgi:hypothetical protein